GDVTGRYFYCSSRRRHTRYSRDWSSDVCSSDLHSLLLPQTFLEIGLRADLVGLVKRLGVVLRSHQSFPPVVKVLDLVFVIVGDLPFQDFPPWCVFGLRLEKTHMRFSRNKTCTFSAPDRDQTFLIYCSRPASDAPL